MRKKLEILRKKILDAGGLMIATILKSRFSDDENKTPDKSSLVTATVLNTKNYWICEFFFFFFVDK